MVEESKIIFRPFGFRKEDEQLIEEMYRLCKDQQRKLFDLTVPTEDLLSFIEYCLTQPKSLYIAAIDIEQGKVCAIFSLENIRYYQDFILEAEQHCVFARHSWGKKAREIITRYFAYLEDNLKPIKRLVAFVPQHNFGVIKLLKDSGFKLEGTLQDALIYPDKEGNPKFYNQLVYTKVNKEIKLDVIR